MPSKCPVLAWSIRATIASLLWLIPQPSIAAWPRNSITNFPVCNQLGPQQDPRMIPDGAGGAIVAWRNARAVDGTTLRAQRFSSEPTLLWSPGGVVIGVASIPFDPPAIMPDGAGGLFVVWERTESNLYANRLAAEGNAVWSPVGLPFCSASGVRAPQLVTDGSGGVIVVWADSRNGTTLNIYVQRFDSSGRPLWSINGAQVCAVPAGQYPVGAVSDGAGGVVVAWSDTRNAHRQDLFAQRIGPDGTALWSADGIPLSFSGSAEGETITGDGAGGLIAFWQEGRGTDTDFGWHILAQRVLRDASLAWPVEGVPVSTSLDLKGALQAVPDGAGGAILVWDDIVISQDLHTFLRAQRVRADGTLSWGSETLLATSTQDQNLSPAMISDGASGAIVAWSNAGDILAQRLSADGSLSWRRDGLPVSTAVGNQTFPAICSNGGDGAYICWIDSRSDSDGDLYAQLVLGTGKLGSRSPTSQSLATRSPDLVAAGDRNAIRFWLPEAGTFAIRIYDASGRRRVSLPPALFAAGENNVSLKSAREPLRPGVYFVRIEGGIQARSGRFVILSR